MQKLIKLSDTHYIVVDDSEIKRNSLLYSIKEKRIWIGNDETVTWLNTIGNNTWFVVTHSTQPLVHSSCCITREGITNMNKGCSERNRCLEVPIVPLSEVEELVNGYNVEKLAKEKIGNKYFKDEIPDAINDFKLGFKTHQELVKDKLFTIDDIERAIEMAREGIVVNRISEWETEKEFEYSFDNIIKSLLPKTEWNVKVNENNKITILNEN